MTLSWISIVRLGFIQMCIGAVVVLMTSTLNRLMVVELSLPAILPGFLVALHYGVQLSRPNWGYLSDIGGKRVLWINLGMLALVAGAILAALAIGIFPSTYWGGLTLSIVAYTIIGFGVGAAGTSVLALLGSHTAPHRRAAAATITWLMMIFGIAITAGVIGAILDPYSHTKLMQIVIGLGVAVIAITAAMTVHIDRGLSRATAPNTATSIRAGIQEVWAEPMAKRFTVFVFLSMVAYFMQELILEPYSGLVFHFTPGQSTGLSGMQNGGVFVGMLTVGIVATGFKFGPLRSWVILGCIGSALSLVLIAMAGQATDILPLTLVVVLLGFFNGVFAVSAIGSMMALADEGAHNRVGTRMGLWGAAQAIAAAGGGLFGAGAVDALRRFDLPTHQAFGIVFVFEATIFLVAAYLAWGAVVTKQHHPSPMFVGE